MIYNVYLFVFILVTGVIDWDWDSVWGSAKASALSRSVMESCGHWNFTSSQGFQTFNGWDYLHIDDQGVLKVTWQCILNIICDVILLYEHVNQCLEYLEIAFQ